MKQPITVLLVEDDLAGASLIRQALAAASRFGSNLIHVRRLSDALDHVRSSAPDVVLLDLSLPDGGHLEGLAQLRAAAPSVPVVALDDTGDDEVAVEAIRGGAEDCLLKGHVGGAALVRALRLAIERRRTDETVHREQEAERTARFRERFIGILGHDLRNPLQSITMSAALLLSSEELGEQHKRCARRISNAADRMARMINDLLDFTRARLGGGYPLNRVPSILGEVVAPVIEELQTGHPEATIRLESQPDASGIWDTDRLAQAASNLIANAVKHGDTGRPITVRTWAEGDTAFFTVHNFGEPIPEAVLPSLFDPFYRLEPDRYRGPDGLGLGLYITQQIVVAHGGTVDVRSSAEDGTTFEVRLPRG